MCFSYVDYIIQHAKNNHNTVMTAADLPNKTLHYSSQYRASQGLLNSQPGNKAEIDDVQNKENIGTHQTVESKEATNGKISKLNFFTESKKNGIVKNDDKCLECTNEKMIAVKNDMSGNGFCKATNQGKHTVDKRYRCGLCGFSSDYTGSLKRHQLTHTGDKPYKCGQCGNSFTQLNDLKTHQRIHKIGDKCYKCDECSYSTNVKCSLKRHQRTHTGEKPYKCDVCGYSANVMSSLKNHKRTHTDDKPYRCDLCGYSAIQIVHLKRHQFIHTGEKPFRCDVCGYCTTRIDYLKEHQKRHSDVNSQ